ncbi:MAG: hypothetical protein JO162_05525 [Alphaproteobacteria bacterium]|nr:hypothetical protein [Alphaproteobacteria bacterium]MBV9153472.1 hypothetical protein [Alphaproteobacteria bacterium]
MDWLVALLVLLGLAALAGLFWLHLGRAPAVRTGRPPSGSDPQLSDPGNGGAALSVTLRTLRQQASHYRETSLKLEDPVAGARCWDLARLLDRAADALENPPEEDAAGRGG